MFDAPEGNCSCSTVTPWGKVTKKMVDPITFSCPVNIVLMPRIEDCFYETTCLAHAHPRIPHGDGDDDHNQKQKQNNNARSSSDQKRTAATTTATTTTISATTNTSTNAPSVPKPLQPSARDRNPYFSPLTTPNNNNARRTTHGTPAVNSNPAPGSSPPPPPNDGRKNNNSNNNNNTDNNNKDNGKIRNSLGAFLKMVSQNTAIAAVEAEADNDNQSISSKSLSSRSVANRSHAERSKAEQKLAEKTQTIHQGDDPPYILSPNSMRRRLGHVRQKRGGGGGDASNSFSNSNNQSLLFNMRSINELSLADFSESNDEKKQNHSPTTPNSNGNGSNNGNGNGPDNDSGLLSSFLNQIPSPAAKQQQQQQQENNGSHGHHDADIANANDNDARTVMNGSTLTSHLTSLSKRSTADESQMEKKKLADIVKSSPHWEKQKLIIKKEDSKEDYLDDEDEDDDIHSLTMEQVAGIDIDDIGIDIEIEKKLRFTDGHQEFEIPYPTNSMYDDLFWTEDELADFRYTAFLEEAGLDVDEYM